MQLPRRNLPQGDFPGLYDSLQLFDIVCVDPTGGGWCIHPGFVRKKVKSLLLSEFSVASSFSVCKLRKIIAGAGF
jgi:hypothetical protein